MKRCLTSGMTLEQIAASLGSDWKAEEEKWARKKPDFKAALDRLNRHQAIDEFAFKAADLVYSYLQEIGIQKPGSIYKRLCRDFSGRQFAENVLQLLRTGFTPVIAIVGKDIKVIPDFLLATAVCDAKGSSKPFLVVPIHQAFLDAFAEAEPELPKEPRITPVRRVLERGEKKTRERIYAHKGTWDFDLEK
jgi:hypothetical protein